MSNKKNDDKEHESEQNWDFDQAELQKPARSGRTVVSVSVAKEDFERLAKEASRLGLRTSEFIRESALHQIALVEHKPVVYGLSGGNGAIVFSGTPLPTTTASKGVQDFEPKQPEQLPIAV